MGARFPSGARGRPRPGVSVGAGHSELGATVVKYPRHPRPGHHRKARILASFRDVYPDSARAIDYLANLAPDSGAPQKEISGLWAGAIPTFSATTDAAVLGLV